MNGNYRLFLWYWWRFFTTPAALATLALFATLTAFLRAMFFLLDLNGVYLFLFLASLPAGEYTHQ